MERFPIGLNLLVLALAGATIWWAGARLESYATRLSRRTGMGEAFAGMLLLAAATSLPEVATTITAITVLNDPTLAVNNLLGGVALQTGLLIVADAVKRERGPLTSFNPQFQLLIQGVGVMLLLSLFVGGVTAEGHPTLGGVSAWAIALLLTYLALMYFSYVHRNSPRWQPASETDSTESSDRPARGADAEDSHSERTHRSTRRLWLQFAGASALVLGGGWFATHAAESLAKQSGLGSAFVGATLLALATSLPEVSTTVTAARRRHYSAATSNVLGSNAFDVTLLFLADLLFREGTLLAHAEKSAVFIASVGAVMTCIFLIGMLERADRTVAGIGWDSAAALVTYLAGMGVLYGLSR